MSTFLSRWFGNGRKALKKRNRPLWLETLEDRTGPSTVRIGVVGDFGVATAGNPNGSRTNEAAVSDMIHSWDTDTHTGLNTGNRLDALITTGDNTYPNASKD